MSGVTVFYAGQMYGQYSRVPPLFDLPDGVFLRVTGARLAIGPDGWYLRDLTPVLLQDVPKPLQLLSLLLNLPPIEQ